MKFFFTFVSTALLLLTFTDLQAQPINDNIGFATVVPHQANWCSANKAYTTVGATPDGNAASCWNTSPNYNVWFRFQATSSFVSIIVDRGRAQGTIKGINLALWEFDGTTEIECNRYVGVNDDVAVSYTNLTTGNWYYISVDNFSSIYRGSFTLCVNNIFDYDYYEGAIVVPHQANWCSANKAYTTVGATPDRNAASCWNTSPNYNRWFTFQATSSFVSIMVDRGGAQGTIRGVNLALWEFDGTTEIECNRYVGVMDDVVVDYTNLTAGNWYYISVDNYSSNNYQGSFTLCIDNSIDYDYYEGAIELTDITDWCSANGEYTTVGATPDRNAGSCWNTNPDYNRWFRFQASNTEKITVSVLRGGFYGTIKGVNMALWESDGLTEVACNRYVGPNDNVTIQAAGLTEGNWYYITVDNYSSNYCGSFTLCIDDGRLRWTGNVDTDWSDAGNWSGGYIPSLLDDVAIPSGLSNYPETNTGIFGLANSMLMEPGSRLTIPTGKALIVSNNFDMKADASAMSSMIDNGTLNYDVSKASYQCYLSEDQWHLVSAPVSGAQSGVFMNIYLKYFTELDSTWTYIVPINHNLLPGQGFSAWASSALTGSTTVTYEGGFNTGDQTPPPLTYNVGSGAGDGWNLIGNPFPSAVEWNTNWTTSNIDASIYVYDGNTGQYLTWNRNLSAGTMPNGEIPPAQGFWAKANGSSPSITIPHSERVHTSQGFYKSGSNDAIQILVTGNGLSDKLLVYFNKSATAGFDSEYDAYKLRGIAEAPQIYTTAEGIDLTLNTLPAEPEMIIPMGFETGVEGDCQLIAKELGIMDDDDELYLEDKLLNQMILLTENDIYEFSASPNDDPDRFNLHFIFNDTQPVIVDDPYKINIYSIEKEIFVRLYGPGNCKIFVYDFMGQLVAEGNGYDYSLTKIKIDSKTGIYIVKVIDNKKVYSEKVYIE